MEFILADLGVIMDLIEITLHENEVYYTNISENKVNLFFL